MAQGHPMSRLGGWKAIRSRMTGSSGAPANHGGSPARAGPRPVTQRLAESVEQLCAARAARHGARYFDLDWKTVRRLDRQRLERTLGPVDLDGIEVIAMDEFAIQKGHRHATQRPNAIVFDLSHIIAKYGRVVIDRVRGRSSERTARRSASPQARQACALAAAEESQLDASRGGRRARRTARQP